jgi:membrane-associated phospholipid phosphatase
MTADKNCARLFRQTMVALATCTVAIFICYYFIDRPVAFFVYRHEIPRVEEFRWLTEPPPLMQIWSPLVLVMLLMQLAWRPWRRWQHVLFIACATLIVADQFRGSLGDLFGRYWPETWHDNNPSLIGTGTYGFNFLKADNDNGSFPSGHATRILAFATVFWLTIPRGRWFYVIVAAPMFVALVAMNYHFVSDVIAGSVLGGVVGAWAVVLSRLNTEGSTG